jgi:hypothetical protein
MDLATRVDTLALEPHPEGGYYRRVHASALQVSGATGPRPAMTAIQYLLGPDERSAWHRVDADECWHWAEGGELQLLQHVPGSGVVERVRLGPPGAGAHAYWIVPAGAWQAARVSADAVLVTCVVAPGFVWEGFELLDADSALARELPRLPVVQR